MHKSASDILCEWADEVLFATYRVDTVQRDAGFNRTETKAIGTGERVLKTTARPSHKAKNRLGLPSELPLEWAAYAKYLDGTPAVAA